MKTQAINITNDTHKKLCAFSLKTGMKKGVIAERAVLHFIGSFHGFEIPIAQAVTRKRKSLRTVKNND